MPTSTRALPNRKQISTKLIVMRNGARRFAMLFGEKSRLEISATMRKEIALASNSANQGEPTAASPSELCKERSKECMMPNVEPKRATR